MPKLKRYWVTETNAQNCAALLKEIDNLLIALDTDEAKSKPHQEHINKVNAKAKEILEYLSK